jgi:hypothetical protein
MIQSKLILLMESWIKKIIQKYIVHNLYFVGQSNSNIIINRFTKKNSTQKKKIIGITFISKFIGDYT